MALTPTQSKFIERLESNLNSAAARYAQAEERVEEARAKGIDTSARHGASAASADYTLAKLAAAVRQAQKNLDSYKKQVSA